MPDNSSPADKLAEDLSKEFGVKVKAYKMPGDDSEAISQTVKTVTKEFGEVSLCPSFRVMRVMRSVLTSSGGLYSST